MLRKVLLPLLAVAGATSAAKGPDADGKYLIQSEGIRAYFIPYGASITNLFVKDKFGKERDVVLGFDTAKEYKEDKIHPHYGGVPGRYANRIKNATFTIDGQTYKVDANEHDGANTLHGGKNGWDYRDFTVVEHTDDSITFKLVDPDGTMGFPGDVTGIIQYKVSPHTWSFKMTGIATTKKTPIMLTSHTYWNLDAYQNPKTQDIKDHVLSLPYSGQRVAVDSILIPTGEILANEPGSVNDFWSKPKAIGTDLAKPEIYGNCGEGCTGYDNCYLVNRAQYGQYDWQTKRPVASLSSPYTGIKVDVYSNQDAYQVYTCNGHGNNKLPLKKTQGFHDANSNRLTGNYSCIVMEVQDWIAGINNPAWQRNNKQIYGPKSGPQVVEGIHRFSVNKGGYGGY